MNNFKLKNYFIYIGLIILASTSMINADNRSNSNFDIEGATRIVNVNGEDFPVVDFGTGPVVLMLHGWPDSKALWRFQIPKVASAGYRIIAPDLRGFGDAPRPLEKEKYSLLLQLGDIDELLDELDIDTASLVGHDWGSALAWTLARFIPDRFNALIAISTGSPTSTNAGLSTIRQREKLWYTYLFLQEGLAEAQIAANDWQFLRQFSGHPDIETIISKLSRPGALTASLNWYRGNLQSLLAPPDGIIPPPPPPQPNVTQPTLGIWGRQDRFLRGPQMRQSRFEVDNEFIFKEISDAGHWLMLEKPNKTSKLIINFLDCKIKGECN